MTREEAINKVRQMSLPKETMDILKALAPELRESEDERIRKAIVGLIEELQRSDKNFAGVELTDMLAYLEKQKEEEGYEAIPVESTLEYKLGFKAGKESEKQKEPENTSASTMAPSCWAEEPSLQKEPKPAWSEEDERKLQECIKIVERWEEDYDIAYAPYSNTLKSLRPQKLDASKLENFDPVDVLNRIKTEWPMAWEKVVEKQEWSDEDEEMRLEAIRVLVSGCERYRKESGCLPGWHKVIDWLKSLRPSWKPSEEQMEALEAAVESFEGYEDYDALKSLCENLKKLKGE